jgi:hypothetical protein
MGGVYRLPVMGLNLPQDMQRGADDFVRTPLG